MGVDERLREGLSQVPPADPGGAYERIVEKKVRRRVMRKLQAGALAVVVIAGSGVGFVALVRAFDTTGNSLASGDASNGPIIFAAGEHPDWDLYSVEPDGSDLMNLTHTLGIEETYPNISPDGMRIAFCRTTETEKGIVNGIYTMDVDGSNEARLTDGGNSGCYPTWSPDMRQIAFEGDDGIYVMAADGSNIRQLTLGEDRYPTWSQPESG